MSTPFYDLASLVVVPSGYKASKVYAQKPLTTDGQLAFSRSTGATRVNSAGMIEKVRTNQIRNSSMVGASTPNTLPTNWATSLSGLTREIVGVGTENGLPYIDFKLSGTATGVISALQFENNSTIIAAQGQLWTHSAYFKLIGGTALPNQFLLSMYEFNSGGAYQSEGSVNIRSSITSSLNRFSFTRTLVSATTARVQPLVQFYLTNGATYDFTYRVAAPQMETGDVATDWISTTSAAVSVGPTANVPRLDYLGSTCPKLLLEPQRTNLLQYSEQFDNAYWTKSDASISSNATLAPDGYNTADKLIENTANASHTLFRSTTSIISTSTSYNFSVYLKASERFRLRIRFTTFSNANDANVNLNLGTTDVGTLTNVGNGWFRFDWTLNSNTGASLPLVAITLQNSSGSNTYVGDGTSGAFIWGAQFEAGAYATSYIPTLAASVTRGADVCSKTGISSLIGQTEGTLFIDFQYNQTTSDANGRLLQVYGTSDVTNSILPLIQGVGASANQFQLTTYLGGSLLVAIPPSASTLVPFGRQKFAIAYNSGVYTVYRNGSLFASGTGASPASLTAMELGSTTFTTRNLSNPINQALLFKTRLTNAQLAELTTL